MVEKTPGQAELRAEDVRWITNDSGELGVKIGDQFFFLYKGESLVYETATHDDGTPMHWRPVFKREFGECAHPINYEDPSRVGTVSLEDSDQWKPLSAAPREQSAGSAEVARLRKAMQEAIDHSPEYSGWVARARGMVQILERALETGERG